MNTQANDAVSRWSTWAILAAPYLDTEHDPEWKEAFAQELQRRGITGFALYWRNVVAAGGLWWNIIWWEWALFDGRDIALGWAQNLAIIAVIVISFLFGWVAGVITLIVLWILLRLVLGWCSEKFATAAQERELSE